MKQCNECKYFGVMKPDPSINICRCKESRWYVIEPDHETCKYYVEDDTKCESD